MMESAALALIGRQRCRHGGEGWKKVRANCVLPRIGRAYGEISAPLSNHTVSHFCGKISSGGDIQ
jgi:hypothetical protein